FGSQADTPNAGALETEVGQELAGGSYQSGGVGGGLGKGACARGVGAIGVHHGEREGLGNLGGCAQACADVLGKSQSDALVLVGVELVAVEVTGGAHGARSGGRDDPAFVYAAGEVLAPAGGSAEDPLQGRGLGVGEIADGGDAVAGERPGRLRPDPREGGGRPGAEEGGDLVRGAADDGRGPGRRDGSGHGGDRPRGPRT